jgi:flavodoxin
MKNYLVLYYSKTGNSKFIAEKLSKELWCPSKKITPMIDNIALLFLLSLLRINIPTNITDEDIQEYDEVILLGPIWGGLVVSPLRTIIKKCARASKNIHFAVTCETKDEDKDKKYGSSQVLKKASDLGGKYVKNTAAFSTSLVYSDNPSWSPKLSEKIKLTEDNYKGVLMSRVQNYASKIKAN